MKKILLALVLIAPMIFAGCHKTEYPVIEKAFDEYVNNNFDDPRTLKEIVSIAPIDTFNISEFREIYVGYIDIYKKSQHVADSLLNEVNTFIKEHAAIVNRQPDVEDFKRLFFHNLGLLEKKIEIMGASNFVEFEMPKDIMSIKDSTIVSNTDMNLHPG